MYTYVDEFLEICSTFKFQNFFDESVRLKLFPFSLKDQARVWLNHLKPNSITTWRDLNFKFVSKFYSMSRTNQYRLKISTFKQKERNFMSHGKGLRISKSSVHTIILKNGGWSNTFSMDWQIWIVTLWNSWVVDHLWVRVHLKLMPFLRD